MLHLYLRRLRDFTTKNRPEPSASFTQFHRSLPNVVDQRLFSNGLISLSNMDDFEKYFAIEVSSTPS